MNPLQRASRNRKIIYVGVIVALFTVSMVWRGVIPVPLGGSAARAAQPFRWAAGHTIQSQAKNLEVWELDEEESEAELSGSALRLTLTGSRGFAVTALWLSAIEKQKRNDFHEFEQRVQWVTKLQPNFITPWIFQSWNITYNVSVEMQGSGDMYYYIARGIELLAEGERRNKRSPDMRYQIAFYYQNKFGVSDNVEVLRCLFDLSCIPPSRRDWKSLMKPGTDEVDLEKFAQFCRNHPHLVRRLRGEETQSRDQRANEKLRCETPREIVQFLKDNQDVPCRYKKNQLGQLTDDLADRKEQFPALPPQFNEGPNEAHPGVATETDEAPIVGYFSAFKAARAWFSYSLLLLPPNPRDVDGKPIPGPTPRPGEGGYDPFKHRVPRLPMMIIFRQGAPRAQSYAAELEQKEGWFDGEGWQIDRPLFVGEKNRWFPKTPDLVVGAGRQWSLIEWEKARDLWDAHGKAYGLDLGDRKQRLETEAGNPNTLPTDPTPEQLADETFRRRYEATSAIYFYRSYRQVTNFPYFYEAAKAEAEPGTVAARKKLWEAEQYRKIYEPLRAIELYKQGLELWKKVLEKNPKFHRDERSDKTEEETYEYELAYLRLLVQSDDAEGRVTAKANEIARLAHAVVPFLTEPDPPHWLEFRVVMVGSVQLLAPYVVEPSTTDPFWSSANRDAIKWWIVENLKDEPFSSPFVGTTAIDPETKVPVAWVRDEIKQSVKVKQGVARRPTGPPQGQPGPPPQPSTQPGG